MQRIALFALWNFEILIKTLHSDGREYVQNFEVDFLQISDETLNNLFKIETKLSESSTKSKTLDDCNQIQYISKRRKHTFYKKL